MGVRLRWSITIINRFDFNFFGEDEEGVLSEGLSEYPCLLMSMNIWPGYRYNQLESMNIKVGEENGKSLGMVKGGPQKVRKFSSNEFWKNIGCLILSLTFYLAGSSYSRRRRHNI